VGELIIVTGPPGAGKSAVSALLADSFDASVLIAGDWFFGLWRRGAIDPWLPQALPQTAVAADAAALTAGTFARTAPEPGTAPAGWPRGQLLQTNYGNPPLNPSFTQE
jgi:dephospho-CoA kinase